jgi:hypothetical protein
MFEQKKSKIIYVLNNHFGKHNIIPEIGKISDEDFNKIIELYEQRASVDGKDPWHYLYFDELIMQQATYDTIKNNPNYNDITTKISALFEEELNGRLSRPVKEYGEETDKMYRTSYANMPNYAYTLAEMYLRTLLAYKNMYDNDNSINNIVVGYSSRFGERKQPTLGSRKIYLSDRMTNIVQKYNLIQNELLESNINLPNEFTEAIMSVNETLEQMEENKKQTDLNSGSRHI